MFSVRSYGPALYYAGLVMLAVGLPLWLLLMSIAQFVMLGGWLIDGRIKEKLHSALRNPVLLAIAGVYFMHLAGMIYTEDISYGLDDLRVKLPLLLIPFTVATMPPLSRKQFNNLLTVVVSSAFISSVCSVIVWAGFTKVIVNDIRDISVFISHIRLALIICTSIACCIYLIRQNKNRIVYYSLIVWFIIFIFILQSLTGIILLLLLATIYGIQLMWRSESTLFRFIAATVVVIVIAGCAFTYHFLFVESIKQVNMKPVEMPESTKEGNAYVHLINYEIENGHPVWINVCEKELETEWNKRSAMNYKGQDMMGQELRVTLIRFLTSKNLKKDAEGIKALNEKEIDAVEHGIANVDYIDNYTIITRLKQVAWEYRSYYYSGNPSGHSIMQRLEFWKTALYIFRQQPLVGTGTGDIKKEFADAYEEKQSPLLQKFRLRAHNEYLTMFVTFGIAGGLYFIFSLIYPFIKLRKRSDFLYGAFFIIMLLSMLTEDTPESQAGATFMAFFNSILLFHDYGRQA